MIFLSEVARILFHQLPTEVQVRYAKLEDQLAEQQISLTIVCVQCLGERLEVTVRIGEQLSDVSAGPCSS